MTARAGRGFRRLCILTAAATYLLIVAGGVVRVTGSGLGCGTANDWPLCEGGLLPPLRQDALIEFTHRWLAATSTALVVALALVAWLRYRWVPRVVWPATAVVALFIVQVVLGALTVKLSLPGAVILVHLANAMLLLGVLVHISFAAWTQGTERGGRTVPGGDRSRLHVRLAVVTAGATYLLALSGALVVARGAGPACAGWPLCGDGVQLPADGSSLLNLSHRVGAGLVIVLAGLTVAATRRAARQDAALRIAGLAAATALAAQVVVGALVVELRLPAAARGVHVALASAVWVAFLLLALLARTGRSAPAGGARVAARAGPSVTVAGS